MIATNRQEGALTLRRRLDDEGVEAILKLSVEVGAATMPSVQPRDTSRYSPVLNVR